MFGVAHIEDLTSQPKKKKNHSNMCYTQSNKLTISIL